MAKGTPSTLETGYGDSFYDKSNCYKMFQGLGIDWITPPQRGAVLHDLESEPWMKQRNDAVQAIAGLEMMKRLEHLEKTKGISSTFSC